MVVRIEPSGLILRSPDDLEKNVFAFTELRTINPLLIAVIPFFAFTSSFLASILLF